MSNPINVNLTIEPDEYTESILIDVKRLKPKSLLSTCTEYLVLQILTYKKQTMDYMLEPKNVTYSDKYIAHERKSRA